MRRERSCEYMAWEDSQHRLRGEIKVTLQEKEVKALEFWSMEYGVLRPMYKKSGISQMC